VGLLLETPGELLSALARAASRGQLALSAAGGGLLSGSADLHWTRANGAAIDLGRWSWTMTTPSGLRPAWNLQSDGPPAAGRARVAPGLGDVAIDELRLDLPAQALPSGLGLVDLLHAGGAWQLASAHLVASAEGCTGAGTLSWRAASTPLAGPGPLGSWTAAWELHGREGEFQLHTESGPLHVDGSGRLALDGRLSLRGRAWSEPGAAARLEPVLRFLGPPAADGSVGLDLPWPPS
jgi:hypothetical protein